MSNSENLPFETGVAPVSSASVALFDSMVWTVGGLAFDDSGTNSTNSYSTSLRDLNDLSIPNKGADLQQVYIRPVLIKPSPNVIRLFGGMIKKSNGLFEENTTLVEVYDDTQQLHTISTLTQVLPKQVCMDFTATLGDSVWIFGGLVTALNNTIVDTLLKVTATTENLQIQEFKPQESTTTDWPSARTDGFFSRLNTTHMFLNGGQDLNVLFTTTLFCDCITHTPTDTWYQKNALGDWWTFSIPEQKWTKGPSKLKNPRYNHRAVVVDDQYVIVSGGMSKDSIVTPFIELIDTKSGITLEFEVLSKEAEYQPTFLGMHNTVYLDNQILFLNGVVSYSESNNTTNLAQLNKKVFVLLMTRNSSINDPNPFTFEWKDKFIPAAQSRGEGGNDLLSNNTNFPTLWIVLITVGIAAIICAAMFFWHWKRLSCKDTCNNTFSNAVIPPLSEKPMPGIMTNLGSGISIPEHPNHIQHAHLSSFSINRETLMPDVPSIVHPANTFIPALGNNDDSIYLPDFYQSSGHSPVYLPGLLRQ